ncbi:MAG TPA: peptide chain release factor N(5)-glutamine methyltransferase, partial [Halothiobacillaceae bacterium]|nr:peptide chain release factor N(5)-glutamine methyltransferase [Halothiobacillaceae bacterium]
MTDPQTIDGLLKKASAKLSAALSLDHQAARHEARLLLAEQLECDNSFLFSHGDTPLKPAQITSYWNAIERRAAGEPVAYIIGSRGFWRFQFQTTPAALIPRPDTELLVERALAIIAKHPITDVADLGTGTGAIGLSLAAEKTDLRVYLIDASAAALALAKQNQKFIAEQAGCIAPSMLIRSHWLDALGAQSLDMIVSNPPYIAADDPHLKRGDLCFEPP